MGKTVVTERVVIREGDRSYSGDLLIPEQPRGPLPLVLVTHEWWGKTEHSVARAGRIAEELGYAALAVDLFGTSKPATTVEEAQGLATPFYKDPMTGVRRLQAFIAAAPAALKPPGSIDRSRTAAIGFCFGGTQVLNLARAGELPGGSRLLGVVSFHGGLSAGLKARGPLQAKVLVLHGGADKMVPPEEVEAFREEMRSARADLDFHAYPGVLHGFTNPEATERGRKFQIPIAYDEAADKDSWERMKIFLKGLFG